MKGKKILITGGLGFLGSNLARELVKKEAEVTILDALIPGLEATSSIFQTWQAKPKL